MASSVLLIGCICLVSNIILCAEAPDAATKTRVRTEGKTSGYTLEDTDMPRDTNRPITDKGSTSDNNDVTPRDGDVTMNPMMSLTSETYNVTSASVTHTDLESMTSNLTRGQIRSGEVNNTVRSNDSSSRTFTMSMTGNVNAGDEYVPDYHMLTNDGIKHVKDSTQEITTKRGLPVTQTTDLSDKVVNDYKNTMSTLLSRLKPNDSVSISDIEERLEGNIVDSQRAGLENQKGGRVTGEGNNVLVKRKYKESINKDNDNRLLTKKLENKIDINEARKGNEVIDKMVGSNDTENVQTMKLISLSERANNETMMNMDLNDTAVERPSVYRDSEGLSHQTEGTDEGIGGITDRYSTSTLYKMLVTSSTPPVNNQGKTSPFGDDML